jgi:hypothetical protein
MWTRNSNERTLQNEGYFFVATYLLHRKPDVPLEMKCHSKQECRKHRCTDFRKDNLFGNYETGMKFRGKPMLLSDQRLMLQGQA